MKNLNGDSNLLRWLRWGFMDRQLAIYIQHLTFRELLALLEELLLEIQYRCDTGHNLELSSSPSPEPSEVSSSDSEL